MKQIIKSRDPREIMKGFNLFPELVTPSFNLLTVNTKENALIRSGLITSSKSALFAEIMLHRDELTVTDRKKLTEYRMRVELSDEFCVENNFLKHTVIPFQKGAFQILVAVDTSIECNEMSFDLEAGVLGFCNSRSFDNFERMVNNLILSNPVYVAEDKLWRNFSKLLRPAGI